MIEKINLKQLLIIVGIGLALCILFGWFGERKSNTVHSDTNGTIRVGDGFNQAHGNQLQLEERIGNASERVGRIENSVANSQGRINNAQTRISDIQNLIVESEHIVETDRRILQEVKTRAKTGTSGESE